MYDKFLSLLKLRRTPRLVTTTDILDQHIQQILEAASLAPSFEKVYPYTIFALTNSLVGISKKEELLRYYRCTGSNGTVPDVAAPFDLNEMVQPILSGLTLVYVVTPKRSPLMKTGPIETLLAGVKDATISATYAMLAAQSLGLKTGMFGSIEQNSYNASNAVKLFSNDPNSIITLSVTVANSLVGTPDTVGEKHFFKYKGELPYVMYKKHKTLINSPEIIKL